MILSRVSRIAMTVCLAMVACVVSANESFTVSFGQEQEAKKIGDLKPRVIPYDKKTAPDVSIQYVMKRYRKLFERASTPAVRIEALNRLNNLSASYGIVEKDLTIDPYVEAEVILDTYQHITDTGEEYQRMDELLYLTAKATYFTGETLEAIKRLELLIGLYPNSEFAEEALFRLAEMHFELAEFQSASDYYERLLKSTTAPNLRRFGLYKLAWSQFRLDEKQAVFATLSDLIAEYPQANQVNRAVSIDSIAEPESGFNGFDLPDGTRIFPDTMRLFAIAGLQESGDIKVADLAARIGGEDFEELTLVALTKHLESKDRGIAAANLTRIYLDGRPASLSTYPYAEYVIETLLASGGTVEAWNQKALLVDEYGVKSAFWQDLANQDKAKVRDRLIALTQELAHLNYVRMQQRKEKDQLFRKYAVTSADYYVQLAALDLDPARSFEHQYLSAQALEQAGQFTDAIALYEQLAYQSEEQQDGSKSASGTGLAASKTPEFEKAAEAGYRILLAYKVIESSDNNQRWSAQRLSATKRFLLHHGSHSEAPVVAQTMADQYILAERPLDAITTLALLESLPGSTSDQRFASLRQRAQLYYNARDYQNAEQHYRLALAMMEKQDQPDLAITERLRDGIANSTYQLAEMESDPRVAKDHYLRVANEFPKHELASSALYNSAAYFHDSSEWEQSIALHERFIIGYPDNELRTDARKKLITAFQNTNQTELAAFNLMELALTVREDDPETARSASYEAAVYYKDLNQSIEATTAFNWFIKHYPEERALIGEALYYFYEQSSAGDERISSAQRLLTHIEESDLSDPRSSTIGAEVALVLAMQEQDKFEALALTLPFDKSIKAKTKQLKTCTKAYERVMDFGVYEYVSAARYSMAYIYQSLAHDIMNSERPRGLSELELEQYEILLEEQAIPIEEQAIALHENNIQQSNLGDDSGEGINEWVLQSFTALATLNPSLYKRPIIGPSYAEDVH